MNDHVDPPASAFGRYLLLEPLAEGGMAQVCRAILRDASGFEKQVALKRVREDLSQDPDFVARFLDEARIVSTLSHGNIVQVFDFGQVDGVNYLAMELVDGPDMGTLVAACRRAGRQLPVPAGIYMAAETARGLGAAHTRTDGAGRAAPVIHRDVSPQNVLVSRAGEVKVTDFGIAKAAEKALRTRTGLILGKLRYMSPEQARGEPLDVRSDIFAMGSVLFELLTARSLFSGRRPQEVLGNVKDAPIPLASTINSGVPPGLDDILLRCLSRDLSARYPDGLALARDLEALLHRTAPEYSQEDLAALVSTVTPPRPRPWEAAHTRPAAASPPSRCANRHDPEEGIPTERSSAMQFDATIPNVVGSDARGEDAGAPPDSATADAPGPDSVEPAAVAKLPTVARAAGAPRELKQRPGVWVLAAAVLGLLAGGGAGVVANGRRSAGITEGQRLAHDGWWIDLAAARWIGGGPPGRRVLELDLVVFDTRVARGEQPRDAGRWFALLSDTGARFPAYWTRARGPRGARLRLVFPAAAVSPRATLRFAPPGSRPLLMRLVPR